MVEGFPGCGRDSQPTVLVSGQQRDLLQEVSLQLFGERATSGDGVVVSSARNDPRRLGRRLAENVPAFEAERISVVDCRRDQSESPSLGWGQTWDVPTPDSFVEVETAVESSRLHFDDRNVERRHFLFDTLTTQFLGTNDSNAVLDHAEALAMTLGVEDGLTVFAVDPTAVTDEQLDRLRHLFDVHAEIRSAADDPELRWTGLIGGSDGWLPLADVGIDYDPLNEMLG